jgi:hypothetical protein
MLIASTTSETGDQCVFGAAARGLVLKRQRDVCDQRDLALARCRQQRCRSAGRTAQRGDDDISVEVLKGFGGACRAVDTGAD